MRVCSSKLVAHRKFAPVSSDLRRVAASSLPLSSTNARKPSSESLCVFVFLRASLAVAQPARPVQCEQLTRARARQQIENRQTDEQAGGRAGRQADKQRENNHSDRPLVARERRVASTESSLKFKQNSASWMAQCVPLAVGLCARDSSHNERAAADASSLLATIYVNCIFRSLVHQLAPILLGARWQFLN